MPLSYSQIQTYRCCPKQYDYAFLKKVPRPISAGESFGLSIHTALKKWGELEKKQGSGKVRGEKISLSLFSEDETRETPSPLTLTTLKNLLRECFVGQGYASRAEMDAALVRADESLNFFFRWWSSKKRKVLAIEKSFTLTIADEAASGPIAISGRFDRVEQSEEGVRIIDFKTSEPVTPEQAQIDLQLSIYALSARKLWDMPVASLSLLFVREDGCMEIVTTRNTSELRDSESAIRNIAHRIGTGDMSPTPSTLVCRRCPFRDICPVRAI